MTATDPVDPSLIRAIEIWPPIGIARMGNSTKEGLNEGYWIGPEVPYHAPIPEGGFKDTDGNIKREVRVSRAFHILF